VIGHRTWLVDYKTAVERLAAYRPRLHHVRLHDNKGGSADLHLPLGAGTLDTAQHVRSLQAIRYDGTITLEVFTPDRRHLTYSRDVLRQLWQQEAEAQARSSPA